MKKNFKRFFTLKHKANDGFTLVELIVVIAIIAILGGVAVPAYSGYVKKAERAADEALLDEINTAFASACMINGESNYFRTDVDASIGVDKKFAYVEPFKTEFDGFFEGEAVEFKAFPNVYYNGDLGMFVNLGDSKFYQIFEGLDLDEYVALVNGSTFGDIGAEGLMDKVSTVTGLVAALMGQNDDITALLLGNMDSLAKAMGYENEAKFMAAFEAMKAEKAQAMGSDDPDAGMYQILANYAVLKAAQSTTGSADEQLSKLKASDSVTMVKNLINKDATAEQKEEGLSQAAMMYAMYTAYANQLPETTDAEKAAKETALENAKDVSKFVGAMDTDEGFKNYLNDTDGSGQAKKDMEGYLASLNIIDESATNNTDAVRDLTVNGFTDPELIAALGGLLG